MSPSTGGRRNLPRWVRLLARIVPAPRRDDLLGDLEEDRARRPREAFAGAIDSVSWVLGAAVRLRWVGALRRLEAMGSQFRAAPLELRVALRQFRSSPIYSFAVLTTVGLGTCVAVVAGSLAVGTLQPAFPYADADRLVAVFATERDGAEVRNPASPPDFGDWTELPTLDLLTAARPWAPSLQADGRSTKLSGLLATPNLFELLGASPAAGRPFMADALDADQTPVVIASALASRLGLDRSAIGRPLLLDGEPMVLAAIMPPDFLFPPFWMEDAEIWAPLDLRGEVGSESSRGARFLRVFGRLAPDATVEAAQRELDAWAAVARAEYPATNTGVGARVERLVTPAVERARLPLLALLGASSALLLLIEFNLALLLTARTAMRARELAVRAALGASASRIRLILLCETALLVGAGTLLGLVAAPWLLVSAGSIAGDLLPRFTSLRLDGSVVGLLIGVQTLCVFVVSRRGAVAGMKASTLRSRGLAGALGSRRAFVVAEVAITSCLLLTATLLIVSFERLAREDLGFDADQALSARIDLSRAVEENRRKAALVDLEGRLGAVAGIDSVGLINHLPIRGDLWRTRVFGVGQTPEDEDIRAAYRIASSGSFDALGLRLVAGRWVARSDGEGGAPVVVINQRASEVLWPGVRSASLIDRELALGSLGQEGSRRRIVGIVADVKQTGVGDRVIPEVYLPLQQVAPNRLGNLTLVSRGADSRSLADAMRRAVDSLGPQAALFEVEPLDRVVAGDLLGDRVQARVASSFALFGLMVAGFGVFALIGTVGAARRQEFAIRRVLGSTGRSVLLLVLREGLWLGAAGSTLGLLAGALLAGGIEPLLFDLDARSPGVYGLVATATVLLAVVVSLPSAWRAARTPIVDGIDR